MIHLGCSTDAQGTIRLQFGVKLGFVLTGRHYWLETNYNSYYEQHKSLVLLTCIFHKAF